MYWLMWNFLANEWVKQYIMKTVLIVIKGTKINRSQRSGILVEFKCFCQERQVVSST